MSLEGAEAERVKEPEWESEAATSAGLYREHEAKEPQSKGSTKIDHIVVEVKIERECESQLAASADLYTEHEAKESQEPKSASEEGACCLSATTRAGPYTDRTVEGLKAGPGEVLVRPEYEAEQEPESEASTHAGDIEHEVKEEPEWASEEGACGVSAAAARAGLYTDHTVKGELVLGPVEMHRPKVALLQPGFRRACSVRLERMHVDFKRRTCMIGPRTYKFRLCLNTAQDNNTRKETNSSKNTFSSFRRACSVRLERMHVDFKRRTCMIGPRTYKFRLCLNTAQDSNTRKETNSSKNTFSRQTQQKYRRKKQKMESSYHEMSHIGEKPYKCAQCSYSSAHKYHLNRHEITHTGEKPFKCDYCSFSSAHKHNLKCHKITHAGEKPYKCAHCSYCSARKISLRMHEMKHTGEKPYKCDHCTFSSVYKRGLIVHIMTHTGEKALKCGHCSYSSAHKYNLEIHLRTHTDEKPYKCAQCRYSSTRKDHLKNHMKTHAHEKPKPYKCAHCSYSGAKKRNLNVHIRRTHTGKKPYRCAECSFSSARRRDLLVHLRTHTGEEP